MVLPRPVDEPAAVLLQDGEHLNLGHVQRRRVPLVVHREVREGPQEAARGGHVPPAPAISVEGGTQSA